MTTNNLYWGYHSVVFQIEIVSNCPIHRRWLEDACRDCGHRQPITFGAGLAMDKLEANNGWAGAQ